MKWQSNRDIAAFATPCRSVQLCVKASLGL
jgi:hypothetical protein